MSPSKTPNADAFIEWASKATQAPAMATQATATATLPPLPREPSQTPNADAFIKWASTATQEAPQPVQPQEAQQPDLSGIAPAVRAEKQAETRESYEASRIARRDVALAARRKWAPMLAEEIRKAGGDIQNPDDVASARKALQDPSRVTDILRNVPTSGYGERVYEEMASDTKAISEHAGTTPQEKIEDYLVDVQAPPTVQNRVRSTEVMGPNELRALLNLGVEWERLSESDAKTIEASGTDYTRPAIDKILAEARAKDEALSDKDVQAMADKAPAEERDIIQDLRGANKQAIMAAYADRELARQGRAYDPHIAERGFITFYNAYAQIHDRLRPESTVVDIDNKAEEVRKQAVLEVLKTDEEYDKWASMSDIPILAGWQSNENIAPQPGKTLTEEATPFRSRELDIDTKSDVYNRMLDRHKEELEKVETGAQYFKAAMLGRRRETMGDTGDKVRPIKPGEGFGEKAVDTVANLAAFMTQLYILKRVTPGALTKFSPTIADMSAWEVQNLAGGGTPGEGAIKSVAFGALGKIGKIPALGKAAPFVGTGVQSAALGGLTAASGGDQDDVILSMLIPVAFALPSAFGGMKQIWKNFRAKDSIPHGKRMAPFQDKVEITGVQRQMQAEARKTLGLSANATEAEIKSAWRKYTLQHAPDLPGGSAEATIKGNEAYQFLSGNLDALSGYTDQGYRVWWSNSKSSWVMTAPSAEIVKGKAPAAPAAPVSHPIFFDHSAGEWVISGPQGNRPLNPKTAPKADGGAEIVTPQAKTAISKAAASHIPAGVDPSTKVAVAPSPASGIKPKEMTVGEAAEALATGPKAGEGSLSEQEYRIALQRALESATPKEQPTTPLATASPQAASSPLGADAVATAEGEKASNTAKSERAKRYKEKAQDVLEDIRRRSGDPGAHIESTLGEQYDVGRPMVPISRHMIDSDGNSVDSYPDGTITVLEVEEELSPRIVSSSGKLLQSADVVLVRRPLTEAETTEQIHSIKISMAQAKTSKKISQKNKAKRLSDLQHKLDRHNNYLSMLKAEGAGATAETPESMQKEIDTLNRKEKGTPGFAPGRALTVEEMARRNELRKKVKAAKEGKAQATKPTIGEGRLPEVRVDELLAPRESVTEEKSLFTEQELQTLRSGGYSEADIREADTADRRAEMLKFATPRAARQKAANEWEGQTVHIRGTSQGETGRVLKVYDSGNLSGKNVLYASVIFGDGRESVFELDYIEHVTGAVATAEGTETPAKTAIIEKANVSDIELKIVGESRLPSGAIGEAGTLPDMTIGPDGKIKFDTRKDVKVWDGLNSKEQLTILAHELGHRFHQRAKALNASALSSDAASELESFKKANDWRVGINIARGDIKATGRENFLHREGMADAVGAWLVDQAGFAEQFPALAKLFDATLEWHDARAMLESGRGKRDAPGRRSGFILGGEAVKRAILATEGKPSAKPTSPVVKAEPSTPAVQEASPAKVEAAEAKEKLARRIAEASRRKGFETIVKRVEHKGSDGKWYSLGRPTGVTDTGETREYYVTQTKDGTTVGKRFASQEEGESALKARSDKDVEEFYQQLLADSDTRVAEQAEYWLKETPSPAAPAPKVSQSKKPARPTTKMAEWRKQLRELKGRRSKSRGDEIKIARLERTLKHKAERWSEGQGVGWRVVHGQINRGYRVISVDVENKTAVIKAIADTGTLADYEHGREQVVDMIDLIRDKKFDKPAAKPTPAPADESGPSAKAEGKKPWEMSKAEFEEAFPGKEWAPVVRRNLKSGKSVPADVRSELDAYDKARAERMPTAEPSQPKAKVGDTIVRYTHANGTGLLNNSGLDRSKLTDAEVNELTEVMDLGLTQPPEGTTGTFYFTQAGEKQHARMLELLTKASKTGVVRTESRLKSRPTWESSDGQIAVSKPQVESSKAEGKQAKSVHKGGESVRSGEKSVRKQPWEMSLSEWRPLDAFQPTSEIEPGRGPTFDVSLHTRHARLEMEGIKRAEVSESRGGQAAISFDRTWTTADARAALDEIQTSVEGSDWEPHFDAVRDAIARGDIDSHPDYPDLSKPAAAKLEGKPTQPEAGKVAEASPNAPSFVVAKTVKSPAGAIPVKAVRSRAPSAIWYHQGDLANIQFDATITFEGKGPSTEAKDRLAKAAKANKDGYKFVNYRAGAMGTVWVLEKDGKILTRAGFDRMLGDKYARPDVPDREPDGWFGPRMEAYATAFTQWADALASGDSGAITRALRTGPISEWVRLRSDKSGSQPYALEFLGKDGERDLQLLASSSDELYALVRDVATRGYREATSAPQAREVSPSKTKGEGTTEATVESVFGNEATLDKAVDARQQDARRKKLGPMLRAEKTWYQTQDSTLDSQVDAWLNGGEMPTRVHGTPTNKAYTGNSKDSTLTRRASAIAKKTGSAVAIVQDAKTHKVFLVDLPVSKTDGGRYGAEPPFARDGRYEVIQTVGPVKGQQTAMDTLNDDLLSITKASVRTEILSERKIAAPAKPTTPEKGVAKAEPAIKNADTPALKQYNAFKKQYPEHLVLIKMGDFYEAFGDDAKSLSKVTGAALTTRKTSGESLAMAGMPYHAFETTLEKLIKAGHRVAIAEPVEEQGTGKGGVKREVTRLVTEGSLTEAAPEKGVEGKQGDAKAVAKPMTRFRPREQVNFATPITGPSGASVTSYEWSWQPEESIDARGEERTRRVSDWENAVTSTETGRDIVHKFGVRDAQGNERFVSLESAIQILGYAKKGDAKGLRSVASTMKTAAKLRLQLQVLKDQQAEYQKAVEEVKSLTPPEITREVKKRTHQSKDAIARGESRDMVIWRMGDAMQWDHDGNATIKPEHKTSLERSWRDKRVAERTGVKGHSISSAIHDTERRLARAEKKIATVTSPLDNPADAKAVAKPKAEEKAIAPRDDEPFQLKAPAPLTPFTFHESPTQMLRARELWDGLAAASKTLKLQGSEKATDEAREASLTTQKLDTYSAEDQALLRDMDRAGFVDIVGGKVYAKEAYSLAPQARTVEVKDHAKEIADIEARAKKPTDLTIDLKEMDKGQKAALKAFVKLVPEVGIDPAFEVVEIDVPGNKEGTLDKGKRLRFRDGFRFDFPAYAMGLADQDLVVGQRVAIPLNKIGVSQALLAKKARAGLQPRKKPKAAKKTPVHKPPGTVKAKSVKDIVEPVLSLFAAKAKPHYAIAGMGVSANEVVTTDGHRMLVVRWKGAAKQLGAKPGTTPETKTVVLSLAGKKIEGKFPRYEDIVPKVTKADVTTEVVLADVWRAVRKAELAANEESEGIAIHLNRDGTLGFSGRIPEAIEAEVGIQDSSFNRGEVESQSLVLGSANPKFLREALEAQIRLGNTTAEFYWQAFNKAFMLRTPNADAILMPVEGRIGLQAVADTDAIKEFKAQMTPAETKVAGKRVLSAGIDAKRKGKKPSGASGQGMAAGGGGEGYGKVAVSDSGGDGGKKTSTRSASETVNRRALSSALDNVLQIASPGSRSNQARFSANLIRANLAQLARKAVIAQEDLKQARKAFRFMPQADVLDFFEGIEAGQKQATPNLDAIAQKVRTILDGRRDLIRSYGKGQLESFYENYFPHIWKQPSNAKAAIATILGRRPLRGPRSFLKHRSIVTIREGVEAGLEPQSWNPVDLVLLKVHEMDRFIAAHDLLADAKEKGLSTFVYVGTKGPEGWAPVDDFAFRVYLPPEMPIKEAYDSLMVENLMGVAKNLGIDAQRLMKLGGSRWGYAQGTEKVRTKFASPVSVLAHEIGHILGNRYGLYDWMLRTKEGEQKAVTRGKNVGATKFQPTRESVEHRKIVNAEWRKLADARFEGDKPSDSFRKYTRKRAEKEAVLLEALLHAPEKMGELAPTITGLFKQFLQDHAELRPLLSVKPSLVLGQGTGTVKIPGVTQLGEFWVPEPMALMLNNYLSPGWQGNKNPLVSGSYSAARKFGNLLNQANLGLSFFHGLNTGFDSMATQMGVGLRKIIASRGQVGSGLIDIATSPAAPVLNLWRGGQLAKAYRQDAEKIADPRLRAMAEALVAAGGRTKMDTFYHNRAIEGLTHTLYDIARSPNISKRAVGVAKLPFNIVGAALEAVAKPLMEWWVPRMKLGAFTLMAQHEMERARNSDMPDDQFQEQLSRIWDSVDNRMGQLVYDNLFWNKYIKDTLMLGIRSVGWNLGSWREYGGAPVDVLTTKGRMGRGDAWLSHKMSYVLGILFYYSAAGAIIGYLLTGDSPEEPKDYFYPKTGRKMADGADERLSLPTYAKDFYGYKDRPGQTAINKLHPGARLISELFSNQDFSKTEIRHAGDPIMKQLSDAATHVGNAFIPFSASGYQKLRKGGMDPANALFVAGTGIGPAPAYIARTDAQKLMMRYVIDKLPQSTRTKEQFAFSALRKDIKRRIREGDTPSPDSLAKFTPKQLRKILKEAKNTPFAESFNRLSFEEAMNVYAIATSEERDQSKKILGAKYGRAEKDGEGWSGKEKLFRLLYPEYVKSTSTTIVPSKGRDSASRGTETRDSATRD